MSVASLVRSAVGGISSAVGGSPKSRQHTRTGSSSSWRWADGDEHDQEIQDIQFEPFGAHTDAVESDVEEAVAQVVLSDRKDDTASTEHAAEVGADGAEATISTPAAHAGSKVDASQQCPFQNAGSERHMLGSCKPCAFFHLPEGCDNGAECIFCHRCPPREKQRRKRVRRRLLREHEERSNHAMVYSHLGQDGRSRVRHSRQGSMGSTASTGTWESCSTWDSGSTVDSAEYGHIHGGTHSRQSSGSGAGSLAEGGQQLMMPVVVPMYAVEGEQGRMGVPAAGLGYEYLPELYDCQAATGGEPGSPTPYTCATSYPNTVESVESVVGECEPTTFCPTSQQQQVNMAYSSYGAPAGYTLMPVPHYMQMQQLPMVIRHCPQQPTMMPMSWPPMATHAGPTVWRAPVALQSVWPGKARSGRGGGEKKCQPSAGSVI